MSAPTRPALQRLLSALQVRPEEVGVVGSLMALAVLIGFARMLVYTAGYGLFLEAFDVDRLPWVYIAVAFVAGGASTLYLNLARRLPLRRMLLGTVGVLAAATLGMRLALGLPFGKAVVFALPIWYELLYTLSYMAFWALTGRVLHVGQGKRLFALIGTGDQLAEIALGFSVPLLVVVLGTRNLFFAGGLALAAALVPLARCLAFARQDEAGEEDDGGDTSPATVLKSRYVVLLVLQIMATWMAYYSVDLLFFGRLEAALPDADRAAGFLGVFSGFAAVAALLGQTLLTSRVLTRLGVPRTLLVLPWLLLCSVALFVLAGVLGAGPLLLLVVASIARFAAQVFTPVTDTPATLLLYQPLPPNQRTQAQGFADGIVYPSAIGLAGLLMLLLGWLGLGPVGVATVVVVLVLVWIGTAAGLGREYPRRVGQALAQRLLSDDGDLARDPASLETLATFLREGTLRQARYGAELLGRLDPTRLDALLPHVLTRPEPPLRRLALQLVERRPRPELADVLHATELDAPDLRDAALRARCAVGDALEQARPALEDEDPGVRRAARVALLRYGGIAGVLAAGPDLLALQASDDADDRVELASLISEVAAPSFHQPLLPLLQDERPAAWRAAAEAAAALKHPALLGPLLDGLRQPSHRRAAAEALVAFGADLEPCLKSALDRDSATAAALLAVVGETEEPELVPAAREALQHGEEAVRAAAVRALGKLGWRPAPGSEALTPTFEACRRRLEALAAARATAAPDPRLATALDEDTEQVRGLAMAALALVADASAVRRVEFTLRYGDEAQQALAVEALEGLLGRPRKHLLPLLDPTRSHDAEPGDLQALRSAIAGDPGAWPDPWTRAVAAHGLRVAGQPAPDDPDPLVSALRDEAEHSPEGTMLTIEKVGALKDTDVFAETPDRVLASLARIARPEGFAPGEAFIHQGALEKDMFVVVSGEVEVLVDGRVVATLPGGTVVGEMQVIDPAPRSATVRARGDVLALRIAREPFDEVMDDRPEIARAINRMLVRRLRAATAKG